MEANLQRRIQRYGWDRAAAYYESSWKQQLAPAQACLLDIAGLQSGERVLDVACGTGLVTLPASEQVGPTGSVVATDLSDRMVASVARQAGERGLGNVRVRQMDAEALDFPDASFDAVLCALGLMYVPDPLRALAEMRRVARPGGRVVVAVWGERARCGWAGIFPVVDARVETDVCPLFFQLGTGGLLAEVFREAGFRDVRAEHIRSFLHYDTAAAALQAAFAGGPVALAYARFDARVREEAHADYLATIEPFRRGDGYAIPGEFVVVGGMA